MDLDLSKESDKDQDEILLQQDEEDDQGNKENVEAMVESDVLESNTYTTGVTPVKEYSKLTLEERCQYKRYKGEVSMREEEKIVLHCHTVDLSST